MVSAEDKLSKNEHSTNKYNYSLNSLYILEYTQIILYTFVYLAMIRLFRSMNFETTDI